MKTENGEENVEGSESEANEDSDIKENHDNNNNSIYYQKKFFENIPSGYHFCPSDNQLVVDYLKKRVLNQTLPLNRIVEVNLYHFNPDTLAEKYEKHGEKEWYFFTPRDRKYRNGSRPNRAAGDGYWKATGADKKVKYNNEVVGYRKALVFYKGKPPKGTKTSWIMHEFRVSDPPSIIKRDEYDMKLDEWVLCRIYKKDETKYNRSNKPKKETSIEESDHDHDNKKILMVAEEILPINNNNNNNNTNNYFDYQSNYFLQINNINPNPFQLRDMNPNTLPFKQGYLRKFMFPNDNGNYLKGHAMDKLGYFDAQTSFHQPQMDHHDEEVKHMTSQF